LVRFRSLRRRLRLLFRFRSGFLLSRKLGVSGLIRFRSPGLRRLRSGVLHRDRGLRPVLLLQGSRRDLELVRLLVLRASARRFHQRRVVHGRSGSLILVDLDSQGLSGFLRLLSGLISPVLWDHLRRRDRFRLLVGRCLSPGVRRSLLRRESQGVRLKARTFRTLRLHDHHSLEVQRARGRATRSLLSLVLLVGRWIGIPRWIRY
jgi:hypothetical protein